MKKILLFILLCTLVSCSSKKLLEGVRSEIFTGSSSIEITGNSGNIKISPVGTYKNYYGDNSTLNKHIENYSVNSFSFEKQYIKSKNIGVNRYFFSSPVVVNNVIYYIDTNGYVIAKNLNNLDKVLWKYKVIERTNFIDYYGGKISFYNDTIFVTTRLNEIIAIHKDGSLRWRKKLNTILVSTPVIENGTIYIITNDNKLYALDEGDGRIKWIHYGNVKDSAIFGSADPVIYKNYVIASYSSGELFVLNKNDGSVVFNTNLTGKYFIFSNFELTDVDSTPIIKNGVLVATANSGITIGLDLEKMQILWKQNLPSLTNILVNDNFIYMVTTDNIAICLNLKDGKINWFTDLGLYENIKTKRDLVYYRSIVFVNGKLLAFNNIDEYKTISPYNGKVEKTENIRFLLYNVPFSLNNQLYTLGFEIRALKIFRTK